MDNHLTKEKFIKLWIKNSGMTPEEFKATRMYPDICNCNDKRCLGWIMRGTMKNKKRNVYDR